MKDSQDILVPKEQREKLKTLHGDKLKSLLLPLDEDNEKFMEVLAVIPERTVVGQHQKYILTDPKKAQEILVKGCLKTSKEEVMAQDELFYAAYSLLTELIPVRQGKFGKV
jgi:hypothetical protein